MDGALALAAGIRGSLARLRGRAGGRPTTSSGGSSSSASPTRSRSRGRRGVGTRAAARRSRSAGRGSRLPARADANGGRAPRAALPPATARPAARRDRRPEALRQRRRPRRRRPRRPGGHDRRARRPERLRQDDAAPRRRRARRTRRRHDRGRGVAGRIAARPRCVGARSRRADRARRAHGGGAHRARPRALASRGRSGRAAPRRSCRRSGSGRAARQRLGTLSRGLRRQASAVAACSLAPPLLLVDEATATLDPEAVVVLGEALATLAAGGCGVLLATQDLHFAGADCDELLLLDRGVVADRGEPGVLCAPARGGVARGGLPGGGRRRSGCAKGSGVSSPLSSAVARCHVRRLLGACRARTAAGARRRGGRPGRAVCVRAARQRARERARRVARRCASRRGCDRRRPGARGRPSPGWRLPSRFRAAAHSAPRSLRRRSRTATRS